MQRVIMKSKIHRATVTRGASTSKGRAASRPNRCAPPDACRARFVRVDATNRVASRRRSRDQRGRTDGLRRCRRRQWHRGTLSGTHRSAARARCGGHQGRARRRVQPVRAGRDRSRGGRRRLAGVALRGHHRRRSWALPSGRGARARRGRPCTHPPVDRLGRRVRHPGRRAAAGAGGRALAPAHPACARRRHRARGGDGVDPAAARQRRAGHRARRRHRDPHHDRRRRLRRVDHDQPVRVAHDDA